MLKKTGILWLLCLLLLLRCEEKQPVHKWQAAHLGGGGYITGLVQNPQKPDLLYARCDVAGMFKSEDGGKSWKNINRGMTEAHHHMVQTLAISPARPQTLFRGTGDARGGRVFGSIHRSRDHGETWQKVTDAVNFYGNGPIRMFGETIDVDPHNPDRVIAGGYSTGLWMSFDEGDTWQEMGMAGERFGVVAFHPYQKDVVYAGTVGDVAIDAGHRYEKMQEYMDLLNDEARGNSGSLYKSIDGGQTWKKVYETNPFGFRAFAFDRSHPEWIYLAASQGVYKSENGGASFHPLMNGLPEGFYNTLVSDPRDSRILYTAPDARPNHSLPPIPLYQSTDSGRTWRIVKHHENEDISDYPDYIGRPERIGWAISKIRIDAMNSDKLYMTGWFGVSTSYDRGQTFTGHYFKGTETICAEHIMVHPAISRKIIFTMADHAPAISYDNGNSYTIAARVPTYNASTAVTASIHNPELLIWGAVQRNRRISAIVRSENDGKTSETVLELKKYLFVQALQEDPFIKGRFYAYIDGYLKDGAGLYRSDDWGKTWKPVPVSWPDYMISLPHEKDWVDAQLFSVVVYQVKNACGTNQLLRLDPHHEGTIYLGEWTEGLFKSTDHGVTWKNAGAGLPFKKSRASVLNAIQVDPENSDMIYAGFIQEGLWKSDNGGVTWRKVFPDDNTPFNVSGLDVNASQIVLACEPIHHAPAEAAVMMSRDHGNTWKNVYDASLGAVRWKGVAIEPETERIHGVACGNGCLFLDTF